MATTTSGSHSHLDWHQSTRDAPEKTVHKIDLHLWFVLCHCGTLLQRICKHNGVLFFVVVFLLWDSQECLYLKFSSILSYAPSRVSQSFQKLVRFVGEIRKHRTKFAMSFISLKRFLHVLHPALLFYAHLKLSKSLRCFIAAVSLLTIFLQASSAPRWLHSRITILLDLTLHRKPVLDLCNIYIYFSVASDSLLEGKVAINH